MILFILNIFLNIIKLIIYSWFSTDQIFFKIICLILLLIFCYALKIYPKPLNNNINIICEHYKIKSKFNLYFCIFLLSMYILIFFIGIFVLRYINSFRIINLRALYEQIFFNITNQAYMVHIINISLIIVVLIFYIIVLKKIIMFFKHYWVKIHIYYSVLEHSWYTLYIRDIFLFHYNYISLAHYILNKISILKPIKILNMSFHYHLVILLKNIHYILVIIILIFDLYFNNWVLQNIFSILPYIFIYDIYIRLCTLYDNIDILYSADYILHDYIYAEDSDILIISEKEIWINGEPFEIDTIAKCVFFYLKYNLNANILYQVMDKDHFDARLKFNYYKDRKHFYDNSL